MHMLQLPWNGAVVSHIFSPRLRELLESNAVERVVVGYSGGVDSHVLLHELVKVITDTEQQSSVKIRHVIAFHINHGFSPNANRWQKHCEKVCDELGIAFVAESPQIPAAGNKEENARKARYNAWKEFLQRGDLLLLAHHMDDQIETALFYLLRGSSPFGVQAIPPERLLGEAILLRPLINTTKDVIVSYATENDLAWIEDESNQDAGFDRNFLRNDIIPKLKDRWPKLPQSVNYALKRDGEGRALIDSIAESDFALVVDVEGGLSIDRLRALVPARQRNLIRHWVTKLQLPLPPSGLLRKQLPQLLDAQDSKAPGPSWKNYAFVRYDGHLYILRELPDFDSRRVFASDADTTKIPDQSSLDLNGGQLTTDLFENDEDCRQKYADSKNEGLRLRIPASGKLSVKFRRGGEVMKLSKTRTLKNIFQEQSMPPWLRDRIPLVFCDDELVAVAGLPGWHIEPTVAKGWRAESDEIGLYFRFYCQDKLTFNAVAPNLLK